MLVLTRRIGEEVVVFIPGSDIPTRFRVCSQSGSKVRIGIEAPPNIRVLRPEHLDPLGVPRIRPGACDGGGSVQVSTGSRTGGTAG